MPPKLLLQRRQNVDVAFALTAPIVSKQDVFPTHHEKRKTKRPKRQDSIHACVCYEGEQFGQRRRQAIHSLYVRHRK
jgi:hypothetical protein